MGGSLLKFTLIITTHDTAGWAHWPELVTESHETESPVREAYHKPIFLVLHNPTELVTSTQRELHQSLFLLPTKVPNTFLQLRKPFSCKFSFLSDSTYFTNFLLSLSPPLQSCACPPLLLLLMCRQIRKRKSFVWVL